MAKTWKMTHRERARELARKYYNRKKDDPAFRAKARRKSREAYRRNREKALATNRKYYREHREESLMQKRRYRTQHPEKWIVSQRKRRQKIADFKIKALTYYSGGTPKCACCGITEILFLCLDHIQGGGSRAKKERGSRSIYEWLLRIGTFPKGLQVLCYNCNAAKGAGPCCPVHGVRLA